MYGKAYDIVYLYTLEVHTQACMAKPTTLFVVATEELHDPSMPSGHRQQPTEVTFRMWHCVPLNAGVPRDRERCLGFTRGGTNPPRMHLARTSPIRPLAREHFPPDLRRDRAYSRRTHALPELKHSRAVRDCHYVQEVQRIKLVQVRTIRTISLPDRVRATCERRHENKHG